MICNEEWSCRDTTIWCPKQEDTHCNIQCLAVVSCLPVHTHINGGYDGIHTILEEDGGVVFVCDHASCDGVYPTPSAPLCVAGEHCVFNGASFASINATNALSLTVICEKCLYSTILCPRTNNATCHVQCGVGSWDGWDDPCKFLSVIVQGDELYYDQLRIECFAITAYQGACESLQVAVHVAEIRDVTIECLRFGCRFTSFSLTAEVLNNLSISCSDEYSCSNSLFGIFDVETFGEALIRCIAGERTTKEICSNIIFDMPDARNLTLLCDPDVCFSILCNSCLFEV